jgi:hypothetical protein
MPDVALLGDSFQGQKLPQRGLEGKRDFPLKEIKEDGWDTECAVRTEANRE